MPDATDRNFLSSREKGKEHIRTDLVVNKHCSAHTSVELFCLGNYVGVSKPLVLKRSCYIQTKCIYYTVNIVHSECSYLCSILMSKSVFCPGCSLEQQTQEGCRGGHDLTSPGM